MRTALALCLFASLLSTAAAAEDAAPIAQPPVLKAATEVAGAQIRIGDLFDNPGSHAMDPVAAAPVPGSALVLSAGWLEATAQAHGLAWHSPTPSTQIRVIRASVEISPDDVTVALGKALGLDRPDRRVVLDSQPRLYAPEGGATAIGVEHLSFAQDTGRFIADIRVPRDDPSAVPLRIAGRVDNMVELPVLTRSRNPGDLIQRADLTTLWLRVEQTPNNALTNVTDVVGKTPNRPLRANQPLRPLDVEVPVVVKRNDLVLIVLEEPGMYLTAEGKALDDGGVGGVIRVSNVQSNRTIDAVVLGSGRVAVRIPGVQQAAY